MTGPRRPGLARCTVCDLDVQPTRVTDGVCDQCRSGHVARFPLLPLHSKGPTMHLTVADLADRHDLAHLMVRPAWAITWRRATAPEITTWPDTWRLVVREVACETCGGAA